MITISANDVKELRERLGISIFEARKILKGRALRRAVGVAPVEEILLQIINDHYPEDPDAPS